MTRGQSLIEIVVAVGIIAVVLVGASDIITRSLNLASFQAKERVATSIAQYQINYYRQQRDLAPADFFVNPQTNDSTCVGSIDASVYTCSIKYTAITNGVTMTVDVNWSDGDKKIVTELAADLAKLTK